MVKGVIHPERLSMITYLCERHIILRIKAGTSSKDLDTLNPGLKFGSIRRIQGIGYGVLEFLGVGTTFDIFQNIHILYLEYGVLTSSGYDVLIFFPLWSLDAMAICHTYGNPDLFITFTSNPKWPEISAMLAHVPGQKTHDRPEVGTRVFKLKLTELMDDLQKKSLARTVEKRGLPYAHILLWLEDNSKCKSAAQIDDIISAELPSPTDDPDGYKVVTEYMLHGPCGNEGRYAPCTTEGKCTKRYPKAFYAETVLDDNGYPIYRHRDNKVCVKKDQNLITLRDSENLPALLQREGIDVTMFTDWFDLNERHPPAITLAYAEIPKFYVWNEQDKMWKPRNQKNASQTTQTMGRNVGTIVRGYSIQKTKAFPISRVAANNRTDPELLFGRNSKAVEQKWKDYNFKAKIGKEDSFGGCIFRDCFIATTRWKNSAQQVRYTTGIIRKQSELWKHCKVFRLTRSMRVNEYNTNGEVDTRKQDFNQWVLAVGDGTLPAQAKEGEDEPTWIEIPEEFLIKSADSPIE
ncbi:DNA helicase PIF1, ATP-dependent [Tanacetum coccineum]